MIFPRKVFLFLAILTLYCNFSESSSKFSKFHNLIFENQNPKANIATISSALFQAISKFYVEKPQRFDIVTFGHLSPHISDIITNLMMKINGQFVTTIKHHESVDNKTCRFNKPAVILMSKMDTMNEINKHGKFINALPKDFKFLIYSEESDLLRSKLKLPAYNFTNLKYGHMSLFEYFLESTADSVDLVTIRYFSPIKCNEPQWTQIDSFSKSTNIWKNNLTNYENFRQFHGCLLVFEVPFSMGFYFKNQEDNPHSNIGSREKYIAKIHKSNNQETVKYAGVLFETIEMMAKTANFTPYYQLSIENNALVPRKGKLFVNFFPIMFTDMKKRNLEIYPSPPFIGMKKHYLMTPVKWYTNYQKLFFPFQPTVWILFGSTFILVFAIIFIINRTPESIQRIFYGTGIKMPAYNALGIFFGISQKRLPTQSFPRFLLVSYTIFCLIFRTAYQGVLFDYTTTNVRMAVPESFDEILEGNYSVIFIDYNLREFESREVLRRVNEKKL